MMRFFNNRFCSATVAAMVLMLLLGCSRPGQTLDQRAQKSYEKARDALLSRPEVVEVDVVWLLNDMLKSHPDADLEDLVRARTAALVGHPYMIMLDPYAARIPLPPDPGRGMDRYYVYMRAPFGEPKELAAQYVADYLSRPEGGYMLTHQLTALIWAEETGLELPQELMGRKNEILDRILAEQSNDAGIFIMDLYAERAAFLLRYGSVSHRDAEKWIERLILMQNKDGHWPASQAVLQYDGQFGSSLPPPPHTTVLAMTALQCYLHNY